MSKDPNYQQEAEKYDNPVPSRDYILQTIRKHNAPMSRAEIMQKLNVTDEERIEGLRRRLRAMENAGQLVFTKRKCYVLPEKLDLLRGTIIGHKDGFGFLQIDGEKEDWFVPNSQMNRVLHGDYVLAQPNGTDRRGRKEVRIVRILEQQKKEIVGRFFLEQGIGYVVPDDKRINRDILIPDDSRLGARMGQVVVVSLHPRTGPFARLTGQISEVLGDNMAKGMEVEIALRNHEIPHEWPEDVQRAVKHIDEEVSEEAKQGRIDLRQLPLVTIDGADARDFDDAVHAKANENGGWTLWVAIADVSYYVQPKNALNREAQNRGNSVYFPNRVVPMLPEELSNGLCSLNPQVDRLCMVCEMELNSKGKLLGYKFYEAVMNSHARFTYDKVWRILEGDEELRARYEALVPHLEELNRMYNVLLQARHKRGAIDLETTETQFIFNPQGRIERIEPVVRNDAHKIIEECMILANIASANFMQTHREPALYRIHAAPSEEKMTAFRSFLNESGLSLKGGNKPTPQDYTELMAQIRQRPDAELLQSMLLRSLSQAIYSPDNIGHFGLALEEYAHFTSPIRRYPDLTLHRGIKYLIAKHKGSQQRYHHNGAYHYQLDEIEQLGERCSMTERRADEATRDVSDWLKCEYMQDHVGDDFDGIIASVTGFGFFVRLSTLFVDGLVHISTLDNDYYQFDSASQRLIGENSGMIYRIGDKVKVRVSSVSLENKTIDFSILSSERKPQRLGKTAKDRAKKASKPKYSETLSKRLRKDKEGSKPKRKGRNKGKSSKEKNKATFSFNKKSRKSGAKK